VLGAVAASRPPLGPASEYRVLPPALPAGRPSIDRSGGVRTPVVSPSPGVVPARAPVAVPARAPLEVPAAAPLVAPALLPVVAPALLPPSPSDWRSAALPLGVEAVAELCPPEVAVAGGAPPSVRAVPEPCACTGTAASAPNANAAIAAPSRKRFIVAPCRGS
jgi:hypothetical protein